MDITGSIPEDENVKRQVASWKIKQEKVRFFEKSALTSEMDRLSLKRSEEDLELLRTEFSLKRSEEDLELLRTELCLPVAAGMKFLFSTPRMPASSQTVTGEHSSELYTAEAEELTEIVKQSVRPKLLAAVPEVKSVSDRSDHPCAELGATGQPSEDPIRLSQSF